MSHTTSPAATLRAKQDKHRKMVIEWNIQLRKIRDIENEIDRLEKSLKDQRDEDYRRYYGRVG